MTLIKWNKPLKLFSWKYITWSTIKSLSRFSGWKNFLVRPWPSTIRFRVSEGNKAVGSFELIISNIVNLFGLSIFLTVKKSMESEHNLDGKNNISFNDYTGPLPFLKGEIIPWERKNSSAQWLFEIILLYTGCQILNQKIFKINVKLKKNLKFYFLIFENTLKSH